MNATLEVIILGSGSSTGVPRVGGPDGKGDWGACDPSNPKNRRRRCSILVRRAGPGGETCILVDTAPDLREQLLSAQVTRLDAVLITHDHADQLHGIDDLRAVTYAMRHRIDVYSDRATMEAVRLRFGYCFQTPEGSGYPPILTAHEIAEPFGDFTIEGPGGAIVVSTFWQQHGSVRSLGFRFGPIAYSSDVNALDDDAFLILEGVDSWIVDALRHAPHPTHANVATALAWIRRVNPRRGILTNLHLELDYEALRDELPAGVEPAYDGMIISVEL